VTLAAIGGERAPKRRRRPSARAGRVTRDVTHEHVTADAADAPDAADARGAHRGPRLAAARAEGLRRIRALYARHPDRAYYSVEVAQHVGIRRDRAYDLLGQLERQGVLESQHVPTPLSGLGRRYFRLTLPTAAPTVSKPS
jgi:hypothetical protein